MFSSPENHELRFCVVYKDSGTANMKGYMTQITVFYDGNCPLCVREMRHLKRLDAQQNIKLEDIQAEGFRERFPEVDPGRANAMLHGLDSNGQWLYGLDVTYAAWRAVGRGWMIAPLRWPIIRWFADKAYLFFARHRTRISKLLTGQERCESCRID